MLKIDRRNFINDVSLAGTAVLLAPFLLNSCKAEKPSPEVKSWIEELLGENDLAVTRLLDRQIDDALDLNYGGLPDAYQIFHPGSASGFFERLTVSFVSVGSAYYHSDHLIVRMEHAIDFLLKRQHEDGTIDLLTTNFHSTPDTGFVVEPLALSFKLLENDQYPGTEALRLSLKDFLLKAGEALKVGGIHTPNHRWVVSMAMARLHELFPDQGFIDRIDQWLKEGIDIDEDGQYTERSTAVYSPLTDRCFITLARLLNRPELFEPVRKNLDMTLYYLHPNGEIATEASRRQDQYLARTPVAYYYPYRFMCFEDENASFGAMTKRLEENLGAGNLSNYLSYLLEDASIAGDYMVGTLPNNYERFFKASDLVRIRRINYDATILGKNSALFTFHHQNCVLQAVRMATAFFGKGQFVAEEIKSENNKYILTQKLEGPYYQPIGEELIAADGNWEKMPRDKRRHSEVQKIEYRLEVLEVEKGFQLDFFAEGTDYVPVAIELSFREGGEITGASPIDDVTDGYFLPEGSFTYQVEENGIEVSGSLQQHTWTQLRGAEARIGGVSVYLTGYTPFSHRLIIRAL